MSIKRSLNENIIVAFKYDLIPDINFIYENRNLGRNSCKKNKNK